MKFKKATLLFLFAFILSIRCFANYLDISISANYRTYPQSGSVDFDSGYNILLWGSKNKENITYGFFRPKITYSTAMTYNEIDGSIQFFPISFLGTEVGQSRSHNNKVYKDFDCTLYNCTGPSNKKHVKGYFYYGLGRIGGKLTYKVDRLSSDDHPNMRGTIRPASGLPSRSSSDTRRITSNFLKMDMTNDFSLCHYYQKVEILHLEGKSYTSLYGILYQNDNLSSLSIFLGAGTFRSSIIDKSFTTTLGISIAPVKSLLL